MPVSFDFVVCASLHYKVEKGKKSQHNPIPLTHSQMGFCSFKIKISSNFLSLNWILLRANIFSAAAAYPIMQFQTLHR